MNIEQTVARDLLSIQAVFFRPEQPFTWASGIKSPVYCDNRLILTAPAVRDRVEQAIADTVKKEYPDCEVLMGTSTAGIAHAAIAGHILGLPMGYVRSGAKDHGRNNQIEGRLEKKIKSELSSMLQNDREKYEQFFRNFGLQLKFGVYADYGAKKDLLQDLLMFYSSHEGKLTTLQ